MLNTLLCVCVCVSPGLIILNAWYGKFVSDTSQKQEKAKVIDVTVPLQCLVKDSKLILTESSKVGVCVYMSGCNFVLCISIKKKFLCHSIAVVKCSVPLLSQLII